MSATTHLTADEIVARVFPEEGGPAVVPAHLAVCVECQERVARLREAWLLDRGAVAGFVEGLPVTFWESQARRTMEEIHAGGARHPALRSAVRGLRRLRHPFLAFGSLAAALILVATLAISHASNRLAARSAAVDRPTPSLVDKSDDELLRSIDRVLDDSALDRMAAEDTL